MERVTPSLRVSRPLSASSLPPSGSVHGRLLPASVHARCLRACVCMCVHVCVPLVMMRVCVQVRGRGCLFSCHPPLALHAGACFGTPWPRGKQGAESVLVLERDRCERLCWRRSACVFCSKTTTYEMASPSALSPTLSPGRLPRPSSSHPPAPAQIIEGRFPEEFIERPVYKKGQEIIVYRDCDVLHSAPDVVIRDSLWRFM